MDKITSFTPVNNCLRWLHNHPQHAVSIGLVALQIIGLSLMVTAVVGNAQIFPLNDIVKQIIWIVAPLLLTSAAFQWGRMRYHDQPLARKLLYLATAVVILAISVGICGINGILMPIISPSTAKIILDCSLTGLIPLLFPYFFMLVDCCKTAIKNSVNQPVNQPTANKRQFTPGSNVRTLGDLP